MAEAAASAQYSLSEFGAQTESVLNEWMEATAQSLMDGVDGIILTVFTVWLLWQGYRLLWGEYRSSKEFFWSLMKGGAVVIFAVTMDLYSDYVIDGIRNLDSWLIGWLPSAGGESHQSVWASASDLWTVGWAGIGEFFAFAMDLAGVTTPSGWIALILGVSGFFLLAVFLCAVIFGAVLTLLIAKFSIALLVVTGPLFLACGLAESTKQVTVSWVRSLVSNCLTVFFLSLIMSLVSSLMQSQWSLLSSIVASSDLTIDGSGKMTVCFKVIFLIGISSFALCFVMNSLAKVAQALTGGAALSAGGWGATAPFVAGFSAAKGPMKAAMSIAGSSALKATESAAKGFTKALGMGVYGLSEAAGAASDLRGPGGLGGFSERRAGKVQGAAQGGLMRAVSSPAAIGRSGDDSFESAAAATPPTSPLPSSPPSLSGAAGSAETPATVPPLPTPPIPSSSSSPSEGGADSSGNTEREEEAKILSPSTERSKENKIFRPFHSVGSALSASGSQYVRMGLINAACRAEEEGRIPGRVSSLVSGVIEKSIAEKNYMKSLSERISGGADAGEAPAPLKSYIRNPHKYINSDLTPFISKEHKAKEAASPEPARRPNELNDKKSEKSNEK